MDISLVVPCYNEKDNVALFYEATVNAFKDQTFEYEMIFVNDGSADGTMKELEQICNKASENVKVINFSRNFGKEAAIYAGLQHSKGDYVVMIDADLQQRPEYVVDMYDFLQSNTEYDSVACYQRERNEGKVLTFFKNCFYKLINKMTEIEFRSGASDFRMISRTMVDSILQMNEYHRFSKGIFSWIGFNTHYMPYDVEERANGTSKWSFIKLFRYAIDGIVAFTTKPLKVATFLGMFCSMSAIIYMIVVIIQRLMFSVAIPGYATIVVLILFMGGVQLFVAGILGEYLARTYMETKKRPIYIAKNVLEKKKEDQ